MITGSLSETDSAEKTIVKLKKAKILVVDDEKTNIDLLVGILSGDYQILVARDGRDALKRAHPNEQRQRRVGGLKVKIVNGVLDVVEQSLEICAHKRPTRFGRLDDEALWSRQLELIRDVLQRFDSVLCEQRLFVG